MEEQEDSTASVVVARADALMQRRRQPSSPPTEGEDLPVLTEVVDPDADLPVLFAEEASPIEILEPEPAADPDVLNILAHELARRMGERLADEIPDLVATALQAALSEAGEELRLGLVASTEAAIRDFLAEREKLVKIQEN